MQPITQASSSQGTVTVTTGMVHLSLRDRTIPIRSITNVSVHLSLWYFVGFLRTIRLSVSGEPKPILLGNMTKGGARRVKQAIEQEMMRQQR